MSHYLIRWFHYEHLPPVLQPVSKAFCDAAILLDGRLGEGAEKGAMLRHLLEAKDCAVRQCILDCEAAGETGFMPGPKEALP